MKPLATLITILLISLSQLLMAGSPAPTGQFAHQMYMKTSLKKAIDNYHSTEESSCCQMEIEVYIDENQNLTVTYINGEAEISENIQLYLETMEIQPPHLKDQTYTFTINLKNHEVII